MKVFFSFILTVSLIVLVASCKVKQQTSSGAKFISSASDKLEMGLLTDRQLNEVCENQALLLFVGNAESIGNIYIPNNATDGVKKRLEELEKNRYDADIKYAALIREQVRNLEKSLAELGACERSDKKGSIMLLEILDGPGSKDSQIRTRWYMTKSGKWTATEFTNWILRGSTLTKFEGSDSEYCVGSGEVEQKCAHEINLPRSVNIIVNHFMRLHPSPGTYGLGGGLGGGFTQSIFLLKGHGALLQTADVEPNVLKREKPENGRHIAMFDAHGPNGTKLESNFFSAMWSNEKACEIQNRANAAGTLTKNVFDFCNSQGVGSNGTQGPGENGAQGTGENGAQGTGENGAQGTGENGAQGTGENGAQGTGENGAQGTGENGAQGIGGTGVQSVGSSFEYASAGKASVHNATKGEIDVMAAKPDGLEAAMILGAGVTTDQSLPKLEYIHFRPDQAKQAPTLVLIDSCYGSEEFRVANMMAQRIIYLPVVVSNPNPTYKTLVQYNSLNVSQFLFFAYLINWGERPDLYMKRAENVSEMGILKDDLVKILGEGRLDLGDDTNQLNACFGVSFNNRPISNGCTSQ